jgi:uncharacterized coiled-coil DUF342 family protein
MKDAYKRELDEQLVEWNMQISQLVTKVEHARADMKLKYAREINEIRAKQREAADRIKDLKDASAKAFEKVKGTANKTLDEIRIDVVQSISRFR